MSCNPSSCTSWQSPVPDQPPAGGSKEAKVGTKGMKPSSTSKEKSKDGSRDGDISAPGATMRHTCNGSSPHVPTQWSITRLPTPHFGMVVQSHSLRKVYVGSEAL